MLVQDHKTNKWRNWDLTRGVQLLNLGFSLHHPTSVGCYGIHGMLLKALRSKCCRNTERRVYLLFSRDRVKEMAFELDFK